MPDLSFWAIVFWAALALVVYTWAGYPLLLLAAKRLGVRPVRRGKGTPPITVVIAAHDECPRIAGKIESVLALDYPRGHLQLVVVLDGCTDGTGEEARKYEGPGVEIVELPEHRGKAVALNAGLARARGDIVVFADVRQRIDRPALRALVPPFADPTVGVVSGELLLLDENGDPSGDAASLYWRYEKAIRTLESEIHSVVGATGALYAIRRSLVAPLPEGTILDDVLIPMRAVLAGRRCLFEPRARVFDTPSCCSAVEYRRKARTLAGNFQLLALCPALLDPRRNPVWLQFVSHKVDRLFVPYALLFLLTSNLFLSGTFYSLTLAGQMAFYALAGLGFLREALAAREGTALGSESMTASTRTQSEAS
jgi:poly-beta-1,6-N-acetyl-D-glucosamine synthase